MEKRSVEELSGKRIREEIVREGLHKIILGINIVDGKVWIKFEYINGEQGSKMIGELNDLFWLFGF